MKIGDMLTLLNVGALKDPSDLQIVLIEKDWSRRFITSKKPTVKDVGKNISKNNASLEDNHTYHQSIMVEIEGKIYSQIVFVLIHVGSSLSYI